MTCGKLGAGDPPHGAPVACGWPGPGSLLQPWAVLGWEADRGLGTGGEHAGVSWAHKGGLWASHPCEALRLGFSEKHELLCKNLSLGHLSGSVG